MVYIYGISGFIGGFAWGLFMIHLFLRGRSARKLLENKSARWPYGLFVWMVALGGVYAGLWMYETHPLLFTN